MGLKYLLYTNILSEPVKLQPNVHVMQKLAQHAGQYCTCATVWHELQYGIKRMVDSKRKQSLQAYLIALEQSALPILPYEQVGSIWFAKERARLAAQGIVATYADGEIAAVAKVNQLILVTRNQGDFSYYQEIELENWFSTL